MGDISEATKQVIEALKPMADKLGQGAAHLYEVYTRQMFAEGVAGLIKDGVVTILIIVAVIALAKGVRMVYRYNAANGDADDGLFFGGMITVVGLFVLFGVTAGTLADFTTNLTKVINPEYHAVERIINQVKGQK